MSLVSVILPVYNAKDFIEESVQSILYQTYTNFELIILNDCSTDGSREILESFKDPRIQLIHNETNLKVVKTLNKGIQLAKGEFVARMDADDIAHPKRFEKQIAFFNAHQNIDLIGSWVQHFGAEDTVMKAATEHEHIKVRLFFVNPMFHPAVMFRTESFKRYNLIYEEEYKNAEDYGLWVKAIDQLKFANIPEVLLKYRLHTSNVSVLKESNKNILDEIHYDVYRAFMKKLKIVPTEDELLMHRKLGLVRVGQLNLEELNSYLQWLKKLTLQNKMTRYFDYTFFKNVIISYLLYLSKMASPRLQSITLIKNTFGSIYNLGDYAGFFISRTLVKLKKVEKF